ncbi:MAG: polysaccharide biosynthesis/export family protein [Chryseolinea sp.]
MARLVLFLGLCVCLLGACVPAKKLVFYQHGDELKKRKEIPKDTVLREHALKIQEYRIQPLDLLSVQFETLSDQNDLFDFLSRINPQMRASANAQQIAGILVDKEGNIEYPVLGMIHVSGLTMFQAQDTIKSVAAKFIPDVAVRVRMLNFRFTVLGEVHGEKTVTSSNTRLTMSEAIAMAGGFSEMADRSTVKVIRQDGDSVEVYYVNLLEEKFLESKYYYVMQNDVIVVPPLKQRTFRTYWTSNIGIITATLSFVFLIVSLSQRY